MYLNRYTLCALLLLSIVLAGCTRSMNYPELVANDIVLAVGDQFTAGTGTSERFSYPELLAKSTDAKVINLGHSGRNASEILNALKSPLDSGHVKLVILTIGFNDFQQGSDLRFFTGYLVDVIVSLEHRQVPLMLIGIPALPYKGANKPHPIFEQLASSYKFIYEPDAFISVLKKPDHMETPSQFTVDGYRVFADNIETRMRVEGFLR